MNYLVVLLYLISFGMFIYVRNLHLIYRERRRATPPLQPTAEASLG